MKEPLYWKIRNAIRLFISRITGHEYHCCDSWFKNCKRCREGEDQ